MSKREAAKHKIDRRMGQNIWGRPKSPVNKREYGPGQHGQRRKGKTSDFGTQLKAKQKLKGYLRLDHREAVPPLLRRSRAHARRFGREPDRPAREPARRHRLPRQFVPTVFAARQFVSHGHVKVNGKRANVASYLLKVGDVVEVKEASRQMILVLEGIALAERDVPDYLEVDHTKMTAKVTRVPGLSEVPYPVQMEPKLVVEFYSR